ncbi:Putative prophage CPS-53 integrase [Variovorax sp. PBL-H6]|uniref:tyrosine-type recombinase/integrase n=1 Tax=Variovorax sp. PBL-H6 TaxID=434009 RepID=UPI0013180709|nr:integrase arm-type DNA-binding domain-containing protein [Variovorax sp. PBL-H6]VTU28862.1 Putative prophage CPS-53 integrase [Variovorax sp. PBL-H6]
MGLTAKAVEAAKPREKGYKLADGQGLYLFVTPAGGKSWRANYTEAGKQKTRTHGRWPDMGLADARKAHAGAKEGPKLEAKAAPTFEAAAREWLKIKLPSLSNTKHQTQVENTLERFVFPSIGRLPINAIPRTTLVDVVRKAQAGDKIETAHRVAGRITAVFDHAQDVGHIESHGAAGLTRVLVARKVKKPMASIPSSEAGALLRAIDDYDEPITRIGLWLLAYTFVRVGELRGMAWSEFKEDGAVWVVPADRVKGDETKALPHVVPMSRQARAVVEQLRLLTGEKVLVLDSPLRRGHPLSENTFLFALYRLGYRGRMTAHGFRALASTVLNEQSGFPHDVIERQLQHKETDAVRAAYNRAQYLTQRRELMQWWADWLESQHRRASPPRATASSPRS